MKKRNYTNEELDRLTRSDFDRFAIYKAEGGPWRDLVNHLKALENAVMRDQSTPRNDRAAWINRNIGYVERLYALGDRSPEFFRQAMSLNYRDQRAATVTPSHLSQLDDSGGVLPGEPVIAQANDESSARLPDEAAD